MFFWNSLAFSMIQQMLAIWLLVPLPFLKPDCTAESSRFTYCWSLASMGNEHNYMVVWTFSTIALWDLNENWPFPNLWSLLNFPNFLRYSGKHFNSIIFRILNSSAGISSPPLTLFIEELPKAHLTSHSRMSGSRWVTHHVGYLCH